MFFNKKNETPEEEPISEEVKQKPALAAPSVRKPRKPKEAIKPWTKKERLLVFYFLLFSVLTSAILGLSARKWKLPGLPQINLEKPNLSFSKKIVLENPNKDKFKTVTDNFLAETNDLSGIYGLYVVRLSTGERYGVNETKDFQAASLMKLPVMIALYQEAQRGNINLDEKYTLQETDKVGGSGSLQSKPSGTVVTYRKLAELMGKQSDNTAYKIVKNKVGETKIKQVISAIGMTSTDLENNMTSPQDIGMLFEKLWQGELVEDIYKQEILANLTDTIYEDHLAMGVPENISVAHKYGREIHVVNDAGIVMSEKPYVVVITSDGVVESQADAIFPDLSKLVFDYETTSY